MDIETTLLSVEPVNEVTWRVTCSINFGDGQRIELNFLMDAARQMTVQQLEQAVFRRAAQWLERRLQD